MYMKYLHIYAHTHAHTKTHTHTQTLSLTHTHTHIHTRTSTYIYTWMSCIAHINETCHTYEWDMSHIWMRHVTYQGVMHTYEYVTSHIRISHGTHMNESCHTIKWVTSEIQISHVTHIKEPCHTHKGVALHMQRIMSRTRTWLLRICNTTQTDESCPNRSSIKKEEPNGTSNCTREAVMSHTWRSPVPHMGWLRIVGCLKIYVSLQNIGLFCRSLLH